MPARTALVIQQVNDLDGTNLTFVPVDSVNGNQVPNTGRVALFVKTTASGGVTVTVPSVADINDRTGDAVVAVAASLEKMIGPFRDPTIWGDGRSVLFIDYSALTGGTGNNSIAAVQMA